MKYPSTLLPDAEKDRRAALDLLAKLNKSWDDLTLNPLTLAGPLTVTGAVATGPLTVTGAASVSGALTVGGSLSAGASTLSSLTVSGTSLLSGAAILSSTLTLSPMTAASVLFAGAAGLVSQDNANLFWDAANKILSAGGIKTLNDNSTRLFLGRYSAGAQYSYVEPMTSSLGFIFNNTGHTKDVLWILDGLVGVMMTPTYTLDVTGNFRCSTGFGCNGKTPQTDQAIGAALSAYSAGVAGLLVAADMQALVVQVQAMAAALKLYGICKT